MALLNPSLHALPAADTPVATTESTGGGSACSAIHFVVPYATGERRRKEWVNSTVELDRQRAAAGLEKYGAGREFEPVQAADLMEAASAFDARLVPVWNRLAGVTAKRFGSWRMLVQAACLAAE
jgi:hypothetical protein